MKYPVLLVLGAALCVSAACAGEEPANNKDVRQLVRQLGDSDWFVRQTAAGDLGRLGPAAKDAVPALAAALRDPEHWVREAAAETLGKIGPAAMSAVPQLRTLRQDPDRFVRDAAARALVAVGPADDPKAVLDRAIKALGGEDKLGAANAVTWRAKVKVTTLNRQDSTIGSDFTREVTVQGLDHYRSLSAGTLSGRKALEVLVLAGNRGWWRFVASDFTPPLFPPLVGSAQDIDTQESGKEGLAYDKRNLYLTIVPMLVVPLKGKGFQVESAGKALVAGDVATCLKVTGPDGKDFTLYFDEESGLPAKLVTQKRPELTPVTVYRNYKDFRGIKVATRVVTRWDNPKFPQVEPRAEITESETTEFRVLDKVDANTFAKPREDDDHLLLRRLEGP